MGILVMYPGPSRVKKAISFETLENVTFMKILVATEKPFAKAAVDGIREIVEGADTSWLCSKSTPIRRNCWPPWPMPTD